jgi:motility quorum-sensing regulator/GCU-specific mRNA interferase toxin
MSEKRRPHYKLAAVQAAVKARGAGAFTATALVGIRGVGLNLLEAIHAICSMTHQNFYKSMTTHESSQIWQDVYHLPLARQKVAYVKVTLRTDGSVVVQFKEK